MYENELVFVLDSYWSLWIVTIILSKNGVKCCSYSLTSTPTPQSSSTVIGLQGRVTWCMFCWRNWRWETFVSVQGQLIEFKCAHLLWKWEVMSCSALFSSSLHCKQTEKLTGQTVNQVCLLYMKRFDSLNAGSSIIQSLFQSTERSLIPEKYYFFLSKFQFPQYILCYDVT